VTGNPIPGIGSGARAARFILTASSLVFLASAFFSIAVNSLSLGLMAISWIALMAVERRWSVRTTPIDYAFLAYVLAELLATVWSVNQEQSLFFSRRVLLFGVVYFFASCLETRADARRAAAVLLGTAGLVGVIGVVKLLLGGPGENTRLGIFQFYMTTAELMMMALLLTLPFVIHRGTPAAVRIAALAVLLPVAVSLYATVTRGAYLAAAAGVVFVALARNRKILLPLLGLILLVIIFAPPYVTARLQSIVDLQHPENASRLVLWKAGLKIFADHPVVGVGDIDLGELLKVYAEPGYSGAWGHVHNVMLQILVTLGAVGGTVALALFTLIFVTEWRIYRRVREDWFAGSFVLGALAVFVGFQVNGLTEWSFGDQEVVIILWVTLGISLALGRLASPDATKGGI
jgi:O-antigen ligase